MLTGSGWARRGHRHPQRSHRPRPIALPAGPLLYPLQEQQAVSGNFGQYRHDHPHGGVDLWTFLRIGTPVVATDNGAVYLIKVSSNGYGRAIYQRLSDGRTAVYGHLSGFAPKLDGPVREAQQAAGSYAVHVDLERRPITVTRGEVLGYAGDTGTDVPHLHFEVRDINGNAVNPMLAGLVVTDTRPPVLAALHLEALTPDAWVDGGKADGYLPFQRQADGSYTARMVTVSGGVGLSAWAYDTIDSTTRRLAPYELTLLVDGQERFRHRFARFNYADKLISRLSYHRGLMLARGEPFIRLYQLFERTVLHDGDGTGSLNALPPGDHTVCVLVADEHGNHAEGRLTLRVQTPPVVNRVEFAAAGNETAAAIRLSGARQVAMQMRAPGGAWLAPSPTQDGDRYAIRTAGPPQPGTEFNVQLVDEAGRAHNLLYRLAGMRQPPRSVEVLQAVRPTWRRDHLVVQATGGLVEGAWPMVSAKLGEIDVPCSAFWYDADRNETTAVLGLPASSGGTLRLRFLWASTDGTAVEQVLTFAYQMATAGGRVRSDDGLAAVEFPGRTLYHPEPLTISSCSPSTPKWLAPVGLAYRVGGCDDPLREKVNIALTPPPGAETAGIGVYLYDRGTWWFLNEGTTAQLGFFGTFALKRDISPPAVGALHVGRGTRPRFKIVVSDLGSGLAEAGIAVELDGQSQMCEYMPLKNQIVFQPAAPLSPGAHTVSVRLTDRAGNTTKRRLTAQVRPH